MKDIEKIKKLLSWTNELIENNIEKAENIDLVNMSRRIEDMIYELDEIEDFEVFED
jgi:hypothetical protein